MDIRSRSASGEHPLTEMEISNLSNIQVTLFSGMTLGTFKVSNNKQAKAWVVEEGPLDYTVGDGVSAQEASELRELLGSYRDCFAKDIGELGFTSIVELELDTGSAAPIRCTPWRESHAQKDIIREQIAEMLKYDIIEPSRSPWASPIVLVNKKGGEKRFFVDYRKLNAVTQDCGYPLPVIEDILSYLGNARYFASLDMRSGFWQISVKKADRPKTAFVSPEGLYQFKKMPFGLKTAPSCYQ